MTLDFLRLRFRLRAREAVRWPPLAAGNVLRGGFGTVLRRQACVPDCPGAAGCARQQECLYARVFEPVHTAGPSGLRNRPRPFVFRAGHLDGTTLTAGEEFHFDMHLFDPEPAVVRAVVETFGELAREGMGPGRGTAELLSAERINCQGESYGSAMDDSLLPLRIILDHPPNASVQAVRRIRVSFVTPTELKSGERVITEPHFAVLFARARDRVNMLRTFYGSKSEDPRPTGEDLRRMGEIAASVHITRCDLRWVGFRRRSTKTGQVHPLGGMIGTVEYEGPMPEFLPYLRAAQWTGVGRQAVWGKGQIQVETLVS